MAEIKQVVIRLHYRVEFRVVQNSRFSGLVSMGYRDNGKMRKARDWEGYSRFPVFPIEKFRFFARIQKIESATIYMIL